MDQRIRWIPKVRFSFLELLDFKENLELQRGRWA